ncbi:MAG TPA: hypothetical protein VGL39_20685 [Jatrophihabitantaceae bacterium]
MRRTVKLFLTPRWVALHVVIWAAVVTMVLLGRWQLTVSNRKHFDLQNFGYTLQWWAFSAFLVLLWLRIMRDARRPPDGPTSGAELVLRSGQVDRTEGAARVGRGYLAVPSDKPGQAPVVYRGYLMPNSATTPARSGGDDYHGAYNDYLWELSLADSAGRAPSRRASADPAQSADTARAIDAGPAPAEESTD